MEFNPLNLKKIQQDLCLGSLKEIRIFPWLLNSYSDPEAFWMSLKELYDSLFKLCASSVPFESYNFYSDIFVRNSTTDVNVLKYYDLSAQCYEFSYNELQGRVDRLAFHWKKLGVGPEKRLAVCYPVDIDFLSSVLAGLKLGATICCIPVYGRNFIQNRLNLIDADFIASPPIYQPFLEELSGSLLPDIKSCPDNISDIVRPHVYESGAPVFLAFDPFNPSSPPSEILADEAYLYALRDALIPMGLSPGDSLASIDFSSPSKVLPMLLSCMLMGSTYIYLESETIRRHPNILNELEVKTLGISEGAIDALLDISIDMSKHCIFWFRDPSETTSLDIWQDLIPKLKLQDTFAFNLRLDPRLCGSSLFSMRIKGQAHHYVFPSAGIDWSLVDPIENDRESLIGYGELSVASPVEQGDVKCLGDIISSTNKGWIYTMPHIPNLSVLDNLEFPAEDVLTLLRDSDLSFISGCSVVALPSNTTGRSKIILLVFTEADDLPPEEECRKELSDLISREIGRRFLPDKIEFFSLCPRHIEDDVIDQTWCRNQYVTGMLQKKNKNEVYKILSGIRKMVLTTN